jgi:tetratricopeptide (TPR) repeat protein
VFILQGADKDLIRPLPYKAARIFPTYAKLNQIGQAEGALKLALELHTEVNDKFGQANDLHNLGELYARLNRLEEAEGVFKLALELHPDLNSKSDHAADSRALYPKINVTEETLHSPLDLQIELKHTLGQANDLQSLGEL